MKPAVGTQPNVVVMTLVAPNTYQALWNGVGVQITGPAYDMGKYPTVVDGIPVIPESISTYGSTTAWMTSVNANPDGNVFAVSVPIIGGTPSPGFQTDMDSYMQLWNNWFSAGSSGAAPTLASNVKTSYSTAGHSVTYTGKLIKVTTGSGVAIADVTYPLPVATPANIYSFNLTETVPDPQYSNIAYVWKGVKGNILSAVQIVNNTGSGTNVQISGAYTISSDGSTIYEWGTIIRPDGSSFSFNFASSFD